MIITSNTLVPITIEGMVVDIDGTIEVLFERADIYIISLMPELTSALVARFINTAGLAADIRVTGARVRSFTIERLFAAPWPNLAAVLSVDGFEEYP